jgi:PAS domain S-box-containing protein
MVPDNSMLELAREPRLAAHAFDPAPALLWSTDGVRVLWANAAGAALFGLAPAALLNRRFSPDEAPGADVARLLASLPDDGAVQLAKLRGLGRFGSPALCACSRLRIAAGTCTLVIVSESAREHLPFAERVRGILGDSPNQAVFAADGSLLQAGAAVSALVEAFATLEALGAADAAAKALADGSASVESAAGRLQLERLGAGETVILLATFDGAPPAGTAYAPTQPAGAPVASGAWSADGPQPQDGEGHFFADAYARFVERHHPLRFLWSMDLESRLQIEPGDFTALAGTPTAAALGLPWKEVASVLGLDSEGHVAEALASRETWSNIQVEWPVEAAEHRLPVVLSGLPVLDRDRSFAGYRGFGVCRDAPRVAAVIAARYPSVLHGGSPAPADAENVVPFRAGVTVDKRAGLSPFESHAFQEIARVLRPRPQAEGATAIQPDMSLPDREPDPHAEIRGEELADALRDELDEQRAAALDPVAAASLALATLNRLPSAVLIYRGDALLLANRAFFELTGYADIDALAAAGGLAGLFADRHSSAPESEAERPVWIRRAGGATLRVDGRLFTIGSNGERSMLLVLTPPVQRAASRAEPDAARVRELRLILDTATDGVIVLDRDGRIVSVNPSAEALFGYTADDLEDRSFLHLFAPESHRRIVDYLGSLTRSGSAGTSNHGREVVGRLRDGRPLVLVLTIGRIADTPPKFCAVFRNLNASKGREGELAAAKQAPDNAVGAGTELLSRIDDQVRIPINLILDRVEAMLERQSGSAAAIDRDDLRSIRESGEQARGVLDALVDLSKATSGKLDLTFGTVQLNDVMRQCVGAMQAQAKQARIVIRTAPSANLPAVLADAPSVRQIVLSLLTSSLKASGSGGQVIVSTAANGTGEVVLRVRDCGPPLRQNGHGSGPVAGGKTAAPDVALSLTEALASANGAAIQVKRGGSGGTLVEVLFPASRVLAE